MSDQFLGEIRIVPFNFPPHGWAFCNGQILPISQNTALFSLLGTFYGGNGTSNFALPNLQDSVAISQGQGSGLTPRILGETGGSASVTLLSTEMAPHVHGLVADSSIASSVSPAGNLAAVPAAGPRRPNQMYATGAATTAMQQNGLLAAGSGLPHNNQQPYLTLNFVISMVGIFPPRG
ncbi:tail Collar domain-containing protein [Capsulimonas corticalis]|uniref:Tail Collar domain-containing protein n=1 Tax=Capsulimonas corticalis TaxID=2219043 RepID=A0A402D0P8_9BACT|nr:tail fiber protein [Capsulimonas corticalis]BDI33582.1 tail Collar domain-containing protein [Capsulimonas corticalis]